MSGPNHRKRPAPGANPAPLPPPQQAGHAAAAFPHPSDGQMAQWNGGGGGDASFADASGFGSLVRAQGPSPAPSTAESRASDSRLARRPAGQSRAIVAASNGAPQRAPTSSPYTPNPSPLPADDPWQTYGGGEAPPGALVHAVPQPAEPRESNIAKLEELALRAKDQAIAKRRGIPPFVQKLSSFLEDDKNADLIRWSDSGDSFVVLDEDEFAKTMIPELFKHNNYASFVRQLNMYGFHKRVGLSDNSMRASERKNKSPSEYSNVYFRRGHPNLLWLINKPKNGSKARKHGGGGGTGTGGLGLGLGLGLGRGAEHELDSGEEDGPNHGGGGGGGFADEASSAQDPGPKSGSAAANSASVASASPSPSSTAVIGRGQHAADYPVGIRKEMAALQDELGRVQEQNKMIVSTLGRVQNSNNELFSKCLNLQAVNDRHQTSINAILNFLANVFRKTVQDQAGSGQPSMNINEVLAQMMTSPPTTSLQHGTVVDLGDVAQSHGGSHGGGGNHQAQQHHHQLQHHGHNHLQLQHHQQIPHSHSQHHPAPVGSTMAVGVPKRARGLLPPIPGQAQVPPPPPPPPPTPASLSAQLQQLSAQSQHQGQHQHQHQQQHQAQAQALQTAQPSHQDLASPVAGTVTELFDLSPPDSTSPNALALELATNPHEGMMRIINDANAGAAASPGAATTGIDMPSVLARAPISGLTTNDQITSALSRLSSPSNIGSIGGSSSNNVNNISAHGGSRGGNNAGRPGPAAPTVAATVGGADLNQLISMPGPALDPFGYDHAELERLQRAADDSSDRLTKITTRIGSLSPVPMDGFQNYFDFGGGDGLADSYMNSDLFQSDFVDGGGCGSNGGRDGGIGDFEPFGLGDGLGEPLAPLDLAETDTASPTGTDDLVASAIDQGEERAAKRRKER